MRTGEAVFVNNLFFSSRRQGPYQIIDLRSESEE